MPSSTVPWPRRCSPDESASESARRRRAVPLHGRSRRRTGNARAHRAAPRPRAGRRPAGPARRTAGGGAGARACRAAAPASPADEFETGAPLRALSAEPVRGLRPSTEDDFAESLPPRTPARIRQTRRQPLRGGADRRPSGREKHDEKITVYCSAEELFELERARLALRGDHGMVVDRGRIVREAVAVVLADLDAKGESSILVRRLRES